MSTNKILWVVPKYTFPITDGARVASNSLVESLKLLDIPFDVLAFVEHHEECELNGYEENWGCGKSFLIKRPSFNSKIKKFYFWLYFFITNPLKPLTLSYFAPKSLKQRVRDVVDFSPYSVIVIDGLHGYEGVKASLHHFRGHIIYRAHNVERDLWSTAATKTNNFLLASFYRFQGKLMGAFEDLLIIRSYAVWAIGQEDKIEFVKAVNRSHIKVIPVGMSFKSYKRRSVEKSSLNLFFLGRLDWAPNKEGLKWFLDEVWPEVSKRRDDLTLHIAGSGRGEWVKMYTKQKNIVFHGLIDDLDSTYQEMDVAIMPIFFGSGTRIKVIESVRYTLPIISTSMGVQGSGLKEGEFLLANEKDEWISTLVNLETSTLPELAERAWYSLKSILDYKVISRKINSDLGV